MELPPIFQQLQIPILYLNLIVALAFKPGPLRIIITLPIHILIVSQSLYRKPGQYFGNELPMNSLVCFVAFLYLDWIILQSPDKEQWRKIQYNKSTSKSSTEDEKESSTPSTFLARLWWGVRLATTNRYLGWSNQVKNVAMEVSPDYPRWLFILRKALRTAFIFLLSDVVSSYTTSTPHGRFRGFENGFVPVGLEALPLRSQFWFSWLHIVITYTSMEMMNAAYGVVAVASGLANPRDCPSLFGDLKGMYTVRRSWSIVWHQQCRRICSAPGIFLARNVLHLRRGGFASKYLQLFVGFGISAVCHGGASMLTHKAFDDDAAFVCVMLQAVAILVEDHVIEFGRYVGLRDNWGWRAVGYIWTVAWFGLSSRKMVSATVGNGIWIHTKLPDFFGVGQKV